MLGSGTLREGTFTEAILDELDKRVVNKNNILLFLQDETCKKAFVAFLEATRSEENLFCWLEAQEYRSLGDEKLAERGRYLYDKYVAEESQHAISISHSLRQEVAQAKSEGSFQRHTFFKLEQAAFLMMAHSNFQNFLNSEQFR